MAVVPKSALSGIIKGEAEARATFWTAEWPAVHRVCLAVLRNDALARDLASDVLADFLFNEAKRLQRPEAAGAYVRLMASRRAVRTKQRQRREFTSPHPPGEAREAVSARDGVEQAEAHVLRPRLQDCLGELSDKARQAVLLQHGRGLTNTEIAELLGVSKQYMGRLLDKTLASLARCLERAQPTPKPSGAPR